jgi:peptidoglycan/LPS O-acetylase OafA/YrhL
MVLVWHMWGNLIPNGQSSFLDGLHKYFALFTGVDLFFAISGFVIARSLLPTLQSSRGNAEFWHVTVSFWIRRAFRLWPAAWLWLFVTLVLSIAFNRSGAFFTVGGNLRGTVAGMLNYANWSAPHALEKGGGYNASMHYWSLSLEEQFYFALPIVCFFFRRWLPAVLVAGVVVHSGHFRTLMLTNFRTDALLLGVLLAIWSAHDSHRRAEPSILSRSPLLRAIMVWAPILLMCYLGALDPFGTVCGLLVGNWAYGLIALCAIVVVFVASYDRNYICPYVLLRPVLLWVGSRSYALYLVHQACYFAAREIDFRLGAAEPVFGTHSVIRLLFMGCLLVLMTAEILHRLVEIPCREKGKRLAVRLTAWYGRRNGALVAEPLTLIENRSR